jgi:hypothetical protein
MWEQYAENHAGACLVFDRRLLDESVRSCTAFANGIAEKIIYSDSPLPEHGAARSLYAASLIDAGDGDLEQGLMKHWRSHAKELFFRKLEDWMTEHEYRYVILDGGTNETYVHYGGSLRAVIVGEGFQDWQLPGAAEVCSDVGADLRQIRWGAAPPCVFDPTL